MWVAGTYKSAPLTHYLPLTEHWDGSAWSVVPAPAPDPHQNWLSAIAVLPSGRAWTIGYYGGDGGGGLAQGPQFHAVRTLAEEWDGTSWSQRETVNPRQESVFLGVAAVSAHDVWAVGQQDINPVTLIEHWDGDSWAVVDTPTVNNSTLWAVDAVASDDVWAVGRYQVVDSFRTLVLHWDGVRWTQQ